MSVSQPFVMAVAALVAAVGLGVMSVAPVTAQAPNEVPRTAWGVPELGGVWDFRSITPLERPEKFADKPVLTEEEAAAFEQTQAEWQSSIDVADGPAPNAIHTRVFLDFGTKTVADRRSSLIIDPPNGRMPPRTPGAENRLFAEQTPPVLVVDRPFKMADGGAPDLRGIWDYGTVTPMVRPTEFGDKAVLTEEEATAYERERAEWAASFDIIGGAPYADVELPNLFWLDFGTKTVADRRTSLIIDPPNGQYPPRTPEAVAREAERSNAPGATA